MGCFLTLTQKDLKQVNSRRNRTYLPAYLKDKPLVVQYSSLGMLGQRIAATILEQAEGLKILEIAKEGQQGPDIIARDISNKEVFVEVKTSIQEKEFARLLTYGHGHRESSNGWFSANDVDPSDALVLGVRINMEKETVTIYERVSADATTWKCVMPEKSLSIFSLY
jgi:hypothetical protein